MLSRHKLSLQIAGAIALATLWGTSVFAESRHHEGTNRSSSGHIQRDSGSSSRSSGSSTRSSGFGRSESRGTVQRDTSSRFQRSEPRESFQRNESSGRINRENPQRFESRDRSNDRSFESRNSNNDRRFESRSGNIDRRSESRNSARVETDRFRNVPGWHGRGAPYRPHESVRSFGRVDRFVRERNGYRVWIGGGLYPIFVPFSHWYRNPLRIGLFIRFGGYWDPLGYWSVYDYSPYDGYGYGSYDRAYSSGTIHGLVESVDYRRGTLVVNDDISRQFVTVTMPRDRRMDDVRPGDYVEFSGDWTRGGLFNAYRLDEWDYGRDGRDNRY
jgi:hypothetical protein